MLVLYFLFWYSRYQTRWGPKLIYSFNVFAILGMNYCPKVHIFVFSSCLQRIHVGDKMNVNL